jgi:hypothetical protein
MQANKPDAPNPAIASRFQVGRHGRGVGDPGRWAAARRGESQILQKAIAAEIGARNLFRFHLGRSTGKRTEVGAPEKSEMCWARS